MSCFDHVYEEAFGRYPPDWWSNIYELLCDAIYFGLRTKEEAATEIKKRKGKSAPEHWPLHAWDLIPLKTEVDRHLAELARAIHEWEQRTRTQKRKQSPGEAVADHLGTAGQTRD